MPGKRGCLHYNFLYDSMYELGSDCCINRYYRSVCVIVRCLVLKQPDCMSLIVEASRSIFARDGPALLKAVTTWQRSSITPDVGTWQAVVVC